MTDELGAEVRAWVERSCLEQEIPVKVSDKRVLESIATLLGPTAPAKADEAAAA
jgi:hypothetical protein